MLVEFSKMPDTARIWIYQSKTAFTNQQAEALEKALETFAEQWESHKKPLKAAFALLYNRFIVLAVDEAFNKASGCSIDDSVYFLKQLENDFSLQLFDRQQIAFWQGTEVQTTSLAEIKQKIAEGIIQSNTLIFNNLVGDVATFKQQWQQPAQQTWVARYF